MVLEGGPSGGVPKLEMALRASIQYSVQLVSLRFDKFRCNSIKEWLGAFSHLFESIRSHLSVALSSDTVQVVFSTASRRRYGSTPIAEPFLTCIDVKNLVLDLI